MLKRHKELLRALVGVLRRTLAGSTDVNGNKIRGDLDRELERLGIAENSKVTPVDALVNPTSLERRASLVAAAELNRGTSREELVERAAYTWINRLLALRAMEARSLIDETLRANPEYEGLSEALFVLRQTEPGRTTGADAGWWAVLETACAVQAEALPGLFDLADPAAALRPTTQALLKCIRLVGGQQPGFTLEESDAAFADPDAIGWAYQFYQEAKKAETYVKLGKGGKASTRDEIAAVTQLFTEPYMVQWLLQNSLGRSYHELYPESQLPAQWAYYIKPEKLDPPAVVGLATLTLMDPCVGSGHFLREAFDMYVAMYREQQPGLSAAQIADNIFERHLHGIDLDPRAVQLAAFTLYLRACELVRDERLRNRQSGPGSYQPGHINLATTPTGLSQGSLDRHLQRHPEDRLFKPILQGIFESLEQAEILGSLLRPGEHLDKAIAAMKGTYNIPLDLEPADMALRRSIMEMAKYNPAELRRMLMDRIATSFQAEAHSNSDIALFLFGRAASEGVRLIQLLDRNYAVVVTNPPYMGNKNMDGPLKKFVDKYYKTGKRDLYSAFILRCFQFCHLKGRLAIVTQQSWMFLRTYSDLRSLQEDKIKDAHKKGEFRGILREKTIETLSHLGPNAFEEISGEVVNVSLFVFQNTKALPTHKIAAFRLIGIPTPYEKAKYMIREVNSNTKIFFELEQKELLEIPGTPITYWLGESSIRLLKGQRLSSISVIVQQIVTAENPRFLRYTWETNITKGYWKKYLKAGGYRKWAGLEQMCLDWRVEGARLKSNIANKFPYLNGDWSWLIKIDSDGRPSLTYSLMAQGSLGVRRVPSDTLCDSVSPTIVLKQFIPGLATWLNSRSVSYLLRSISGEIKFRESYVGRVPIPDSIPGSLPLFEKLLMDLKVFWLSFNPLENEYSLGNPKNVFFMLEAYLATLEGIAEKIVIGLQGFDPKELAQIIEETGTPSGWFTLLRNYDKLPQLPYELNLPALPQEALQYFLKQERLNLNINELSRIKNNLRALFEAGPGAKDIDQEAASKSEEDLEDEDVSGAFIPIPTETFLEELSVKLQIHPISVYWLLEELRAEGVRCKPEEKRLLEDRLTVLVLRLMGHRWPKQLEAGEAVPGWADKDGILTLTQGAGGPEERTLFEQVRERLRAEEGPLGAQQTEALLAELTGQSLEEWLRKTFFPRHVRQFKSRPIAWHLASQPDGAGKKKGGTKRPPAFECLLYYHVCGGDVLARIRTQYVEPLIRAERNNLSAARQNKNDTAAAIASDRLRELEEFAEKLRQVEESGFDTPEMEKLLATEPLDRWSGDGYLAPTSHEELLQQERSWRVDINDGVRVNIAPLQLAGLLAGDVLKAPDAKKALADRARWRADERRWVREGKLPRCGWMSEDVPENPAWTRLAPQRAAEQQKLDLKRKTVLEKVQ